MQSAIRIETGADRLTVSSPYHPDFPPAARGLGGRWDGARKAWSFDARDEARVRDLCREVYGTDGTQTQLVTVRVRIPEETRAAEYYACGRQVARRRGRDESVIFGAGVIVVSGGFPSCGGSMKDPRLAALPGTVLEVRDVPLAIAQAEEVEIVDDKVAADPRAAIIDAARQALAALTPEERAALISDMERSRSRKEGRA